MRHARAIYGAFDWYTVVGRYSSFGIGLVDAQGKKIDHFADAVTRLDVATLSRGAYFQFTSDCALEGSDGIGMTRMQLEDIWRTVNAEDFTTRKSDRHNHRRYLTRQEWLQVLIRIAVAKHVRVDPISGFPRGNVAQAVDKLLYVNVLGKLPRGSLHNANAFRKAHCYIEGVDRVLKEHMATLKALFAVYASLDAAPDAEHELADRQRLNVGEWLKCVHDVGLLEMGLVDVPMALQAFQWSRIRTLSADGHYTDESEINSCATSRLRTFSRPSSGSRREWRCRRPRRSSRRSATGGRRPSDVLREGETRPGGTTSTCSGGRSRGRRGRASARTSSSATSLGPIEHNIVAGIAAQPVSEATAGRGGGRRRRPAADRPEGPDRVRPPALRPPPRPRRLEPGRLVARAPEVLAAMRRVESSIMDALRHVPAFDVLPEEQPWQLRSALSIAKFEDGERIIHQGDEGDTFYLITSGHCEVLRFDETYAVGERGGEERLGRLHASDCFGERALLYNEPRAASIRAGPGCRLYVVFITRAAFEAALGKPLEAFQRLKSGAPPAAGRGRRAARTTRSRAPTGLPA